MKFVNIYLRRYNLHEFEINFVDCLNILLALIIHDNTFEKFEQR